MCSGQFGDLSSAFGSVVFVVIIVILALWDAVWKAIGMWKAARNGSVGWYIAILIFNTVGILPILYIYVFGKKKKDGIDIGE